MVRGEIKGGKRRVVGGAETAERMQLAERAMPWLGNAPLVALGRDRFRSDAVRADPVGADLGGEMLCEDFDAGFGGRVPARGPDRRSRSPPK